MADYNNVTPYNLNPHIRRQLDLNSDSIKCLVDDNLQSIIVDINNLTVVRGQDWKSNISLIDFFHPVEQFIEYELMLEPHSEPNLTTLNYGNISDSDNGVSFIAILPLYSKTELKQSDWSLNMRFDEDVNWRELGRILMFSATDNSTIKPIELQNLTTETIPIRLLIGR